MEDNSVVNVVYNGRKVEARLGLGDKVEKLIKPIAKALKLPCLDSNGNLLPESGCKKRKDLLNKIKL